MECPSNGGSLHSGRPEPISVLRHYAGHRQVYREECSFSVPGAFGLNGSAMELYKMLSDGEADAETAVSARRCAIALNERLEYVRKKLAIDALAVIADAESNFRIIMLQGDLDAAVLRGELDGVANQVQENLPETSAITENLGSVLQVRRQVQEFGTSQKGDSIQCLLNNTSEVDRFGFD